MFLHVTSVRYMKDYKLKLTFNNGAEGVVDLQDELYGEVFEPLKDSNYTGMVSGRRRSPANIEPRAVQALTPCLRMVEV